MVGPSVIGVVPVGIGSRIPVIAGILISIRGILLVPVVLRIRGGRRGLRAIRRCSWSVAAVLAIAIPLRGRILRMSI